MAGTGLLTCDDQAVDLSLQYLLADRPKRHIYSKHLNHIFQEAGIDPGGSANAILDDSVATIWRDLHLHQRLPPDKQNQLEDILRDALVEKIVRSIMGKMSARRSMGAWHETVDGRVDFTVTRRSMLTESREEFLRLREEEHVRVQEKRREMVWSLEDERSTGQVVGEWRARVGVEPSRESREQLLGWREADALSEQSAWSGDAEDGKTGSNVVCLGSRARVSGRYQGTGALDAAATLPNGLPRHEPSPRVALPNALLPDGLPPNASPPSDLPPMALPPNGLPAHGLPPHALPAHGLPPHGLPPHSLPPHGLPPNGLPPHGLPTPPFHLTNYTSYVDSSSNVVQPANNLDINITSSPPAEPSARMPSIVPSDDDVEGRSRKRRRVTDEEAEFASELHWRLTQLAWTTCEA
ncbi:hypothetical protein B0A55_09879 [Friedmanniomyces simplex]|uniref:Uncharacterized protein n=1 Tax=Friedmanniomyces simplex TaxID=329884 RepID=A0A4U0WR18_9PEZI|nr:hypothetical protein B0A55_09879 [Friedmanniomyces simplex]